MMYLEEVWHAWGIKRNFTAGAIYPTASQCINSNRVERFSDFTQTVLSVPECFLTTLLPWT